MRRNRPNWMRMLLTLPVLQPLYVILVSRQVGNGDNIYGYDGMTVDVEKVNYRPRRRVSNCS